MSDYEDRIAQLRADIEALKKEAAELKEGRKAVDFTQEEIARVEEIAETLDYKHSQLESCMRLERIATSETESTPQRRTAPSGGGERRSALIDRRAGFAHLGDFAQCVRHGQTPGNAVDQRLAELAPTTYSQTGVGAEGGFAVPPEFSARIMEYVGDENSLYARVDKTPVNHGLYWPVDEDSPWATTGPQAYWEGEADQYTQSKVNLRTAGFRLNKVVVLCPVTDELLDDAGQMETYLRSVISKRLRWKVDFAILQGTGAGMPLGILNSPALKSVAKEGSQTADTVTDGNVFAMWNALFGEYRSNATWVYNQDIEVQLLTMVLAGASSDVPIWLPAGQYNTAANAPNTTLFGRPAIPHQACETLGDKGDIFFCDFSQYILGQKTTGPSFDISMHLYFDYGMQAFRATWRVAGMPKWSTTISARDGSATYSPFVTLAERA